MCTKQTEQFKNSERYYKSNTILEKNKASGAFKKW